MATVSDFREQARAFEQQGQVHKALAIYRHILKHVEGTPALVKVLPVYVKVGDLLLKQNQREEAVAFYEKAAEQYAQQGSAQRVSALCAKILRADQQRSGVDVAYARKLMEHGHVSAAGDVLSHYADTAGLTKFAEALDELTGTPDAEVEPMLQRLLDSLEQGERTATEKVAERVSLQIQRITDGMAGDLLGVSAVVGGATEQKPELTPHMIDLGFSKSPITTKKPLQQVDTVWHPASQEGEPEQPPLETRGPDKLEIQAAAPPPPSRPPTTPRAEPARRPLQAPPPQTQHWYPTRRRSGPSPLLFAIAGFVLGALLGAAVTWVVFV